MIQRLVESKWHPRVATKLNGFDPLTKEDITHLEFLGAEVVLLDLKNLSSIFVGVKKLFIYDDLEEVEGLTEETTLFISEALRNGVEHIVKSSFLGCEKWQQVPGYYFTIYSIFFNIFF